VSNNTNGTEDDVLWEEDHEEYLLLVMSVDSDDLTQWCMFVTFYYKNSVINKISIIYYIIFKSGDYLIPEY
jgi:hypothetical protein